MNYRTHQGILDVAALVVDLIVSFFPQQLDVLQREKALFPGPHPLLLSAIDTDELAILFGYDDRRNSQVEVRAPAGARPHAARGGSA